MSEVEVTLYEGAYTGSEIDAAIADSITHVANSDIHLTQEQATAIAASVTHAANSSIHLTEEQATKISTSFNGKLGTALTNNQDIFQLQAGVYYRQSSTVIIQNLPSEGVKGAFFCVVVNSITVSRRKIFLFPTTASEANTFFTATELSNGFTDWSKFTADDGLISPKAMKGKTYWAFGDSIVARQGTKGHLQEYYDEGELYGYVPRIEEYFGLVAENKGIGGHYLAQDIATLLALDYSEVDFVTIAYGTNDGKSAKPVGTVDSTDQTTYAGALNAFLTKIYTDNPMMKCVVFTPIQRKTQNSYGSFVPDANGTTLEDFANMAVAVSAKHATPCVDLFHTCGISEGTFNTLLYDGLHPKNNGYVKMWDAMRSTLIGLLTG